jgi:pimeloyl-ACP methyl ester carboxylesterase
LAAALLLAYVATCVLFYKAQWQLVLHPSHGESHQPSEYGLAARLVTFAPNEAGTPQIKGWIFLSSTPGAPWVLMLPSGNGSAGDSLARAHTFTQLGYQVLLFDYRGFGASLGHHPSQAQMEKDSEDAFSFLRTQPGFAEAQTILYGTGAGASLATRLAGQHPELAALILEQADGDFASRASVDSRAKPVPFKLLFHEDFPLADPLRTLNMPKLLISTANGTLPLVYKRAADPKMILELPSADDAGFMTGTRRFLGMYLPKAPETLLPGAP